ncbi:MAG: hypothetical protein ACKKMW_00690 [Candidatus Nealsonbacteria bacterium]
MGIKKKLISKIRGSSISMKDVRKSIHAKYEAEKELLLTDRFLNNIKQALGNKKKFDKKIRKTIEGAKKKFSVSITEKGESTETEEEIQCPYCGVLTPTTSSLCPFCGADIKERIEKTKETIAEK